MKYIIEFKKTGVICYTSHLDIMKVFKRAFKRAEISLEYSKGFNPHPKMGFAQPLSLGYEGLQEYIEFDVDETKCSFKGDEILEKMKSIMPEGLTLVSIKEAPDLKKTLAAITVAADYIVHIPLRAGKLNMNGSELWHKYMDQDEIITLKKQKKKKDLVEVNIKPKIRKLAFFPSDDKLKMEMELDSGSVSNLSPELVIGTVLECFQIDTPRSDIEVTRTKIYFEREEYN